MIAIKKDKDSFQRFTMIFWMLILCNFTVFSQVTKQQLDSCYKNNQEKVLEQTFVNTYDTEKIY